MDLIMIDLVFFHVFPNHNTDINKNPEQIWTILVIIANKAVTSFRHKRTRFNDDYD